MPRCLVALGSNLGDRAEFVSRAIEQLGSLSDSSTLCASGLRETPPIGGASAQSSYLNAAVALDTTLSPQELHRALVQIELNLGRQRGEQWGPRTIDLDLLLFGDAVIDTPELVVPHPRMAFRRFVLEPAAEVAADMTHPTIGWTVRRLLDHLNAPPTYLALVGLPGSGKTAMANRVAAAFAGRAILAPAQAALGSEGVAGPALGRQIEFLDRLVELLDRGRPLEDSVLAVSDFYFDQCLTSAAQALSDDEMAMFRRAWQAASEQVILPKLLVVLDTPQATHRTSDLATSAPSDPRSAEAISQVRLRKDLLALAARPCIGPVLYAGTDAPTQFLEISAAVQAMQ